MNKFIKKISSCCPAAEAVINGSPAHPDLHGTARFYNAQGGSIVAIEVNGLPSDEPFTAVHIHNGSTCTGNSADAFADAGTHLNFQLLEHPLHTGDFPALLNNNGYAWSVFYTDRFTPYQVVGYPVIIHIHPDDYHTQPSGNAGEKIGCGIITAK